MTHDFVISREARADIAEAIRWFREISPELSDRFRVELVKVYSAILDHPAMYSTVYRNFRRALLRRFPYAVLYAVEGQIVLIVAVVHQSRDETVWKRRA